MLKTLAIIKEQRGWQYAAWPTRLYLVGLDGRVVYAGGLGPYGFRPAALGKASEEYLVRVGTSP